MKIKEWITREVVTVSPETSVKQAFGLMKSMGIRDEIQVEDVMVSPVITIGEDAVLKEAAKKMVENRVGALPVVDSKGKMVGVVGIGFPEGLRRRQAVTGYSQKELPTARAVAISEWLSGTLRGRPETRLKSTVDISPRRL